MIDLNNFLVDIESPLTAITYRTICTLYGIPHTKPDHGDMDSLWSTTQQTGSRAPLRYYGVRNGLSYNTDSPKRMYTFSNIAKFNTYAEENLMLLGKTYTVTEDDVTMIGKGAAINLQDSNTFYYRAVTTYTNTTAASPVLNIDASWCFKARNRSFRLATKEEKAHLKSCMDAGKYVAAKTLEEKVKEPETGSIRDLKVGDRVRLKKSSTYFYQSGGTSGTILRIAAGNVFAFTVKWDNEHKDTYRDLDLYLATPPDLTVPEGVETPGYRTNYQSVEIRYEVGDYVWCDGVTDIVSRIDERSTDLVYYSEILGWNSNDTLRAATEAEVSVFEEFKKRFKDRSKDEGSKPKPYVQGDYARVIGTEGTDMNHAGQMCKYVGRVIRIRSVYSSARTLAQETADREFSWVWSFDSLAPSTKHEYDTQKIVKEEIATVSKSMVDEEQISDTAIRFKHGSSSERTYKLPTVWVSPKKPKINNDIILPDEW